MPPIPREPHRTRSASSGFTLAEVAVTIVIVGVTLVWLLQGLSTARVTAQHSKQVSIANQLALITLGQIAAGLYQDDELNGYTDTYAEEGYPAFNFELRVGEETFSHMNVEDDSYDRFDSFTYREDRRQEDLEDQDLEEEELPFEKVRVRVSFPKFGEYKNELILERWIPWEQVYGPSEDAPGNI